MAYVTRAQRKRGGKAGEGQPIDEEKGHLYNAQGSNEAKEIDAESDGFKKGGRAKKKSGGEVEGEKAKRHLGRRARGGGMAPKSDDKDTVEERDEDEPEHSEEERPERARGGRAMARGGSPFSAARKLTDFDNDKKTGPGEQAPVIP
jgi:hypothetical protein